MKTNITIQMKLMGLKHGLTIDKLLRQYDAMKYTISKQAEDLKVTPATIISWRKRLGLPNKGRGRPRVYSPAEAKARHRARALANWHKNKKVRTK